MLRITVFLSAALLLSPLAASAQAVAADTPTKTASGATFTLPKAWSVTTNGPVVVASPPETDAHVAVVDIDDAPDAKAAAAKAWSLYKPQTHAFKVITPARPAMAGKSASLSITKRPRTSDSTSAPRCCARASNGLWCCATAATPPPKSAPPQ